MRLCNLSEYCKVLIYWLGLLYTRRIKRITSSRNKGVNRNPIHLFTYKYFVLSQIYPPSVSNSFHCEQHQFCGSFRGTSTWACSPICVCFSGFKWGKEEDTQSLSLPYAGWISWRNALGRRNFTYSVLFLHCSKIFTNKEVITLGISAFLEEKFSSRQKGGKYLTSKLVLKDSLKEVPVRTLLSGL